MSLHSFETEVDIYSTGSKHGAYASTRPVVYDTELATSGLDEIDAVSEAGMFDHWDGDDMRGYPACGFRSGSWCVCQRRKVYP